MTLDLQAIYQSGKTWDQIVSESGHHGDRMVAIYDTLCLSESDFAFLRGISRDVHILGISESWCGDCIRQLPIMARMCAVNPHLQLRIIDRDNHLDVMERYLFNGAQAIPVFVFFNKNFIEVGNWKARPRPCQDIIARGKAAGKLAQAKQEVARWMDETGGRLSIEDFKYYIEMATEAAE